VKEDYDLATIMKLVQKNGGKIILVSYIAQARGAFLRLFFW
jgi:hypothetical protein